MMILERTLVSTDIGHHYIEDEIHDLAVAWSSSSRAIPALSEGI